MLGSRPGGAAPLRCSPQLDVDPTSKHKDSPPLEISPQLVFKQPSHCREEGKSGVDVTMELEMHKLYFRDLEIADHNET